MNEVDAELRNEADLPKRGDLHSKADARDEESGERQGGDMPVPYSEDAFLGGQVFALQPVKGYRAGIDAVLLAAAVDIAEGVSATVLDAGSGAGVVGLCLAARVADARVTMLERAPELTAFARENARRNGWAERISVLEGDLTGPAADLVTAGLKLESFDHVLANPPYYTEGRGTAAANSLKAGSHAMASQSLERWARFLAAAAKPGGQLTLIHRADALGDLLAVLSRRFGALRLRPIYPRASAPANRIIITGVKGSRAPLTLLPGLVLHGAKGVEGRRESAFTPQADTVLRHGAGLKEAIADVDGNNQGDCGES